MKIEQEIFNRYRIDITKLQPYGFIKEETTYRYSKNIINNTFRVDISISDTGEVKGQIFDLTFDEEYTNYRIKNQVGEFVAHIREEFESILIAIRNHCTTKQYFIGKQANRIADFIIEKYETEPEFPWAKSPGFGVFRNSKSKKWYALFMHIPKSKLDEGEYEVEIVNVKLATDKIPELVKRDGIYPAYHMSKKYWVSLLLDDTLSDSDILSYIEESYHFT